MLELSLLTTLARFSSFPGSVLLPRLIRESVLGVISSRATVLITTSTDSAPAPYSLFRLPGDSAQWPRRSSVILSVPGFCLIRIGESDWCGWSNNISISLGLASHSETWRGISHKRFRWVWYKYVLGRAGILGICGFSSFILIVCVYFMIFFSAESFSDISLPGSCYPLSGSLPVRYCSYLISFLSLCLPFCLFFFFFC